MPSRSLPLGKLYNVPSLPPHFLPRDDDLTPLKQKLLASSRVVLTGTTSSTSQSAQRVSVQGMGGIGKSVLATAIGHDLEVQQAFPDGVFWIPLGQEPKLLEWQTALAEWVGDSKASFSEIPQGKVQLKSLLADKACLLILDDVWQVAHSAAFEVMGERGKLLITTRDGAIATGLGATIHGLDLLLRSQALQLLAQWTNNTVENLPAEANSIAAECGDLPLALAMVGAMLRGKPIDRWQNVLHRLRCADLEKIRQQFPDYPYADLLKAMQVSVDALTASEQQRYFDFAVFPEDVPIPERVLQIFWQPDGLDEYDTQDVVDLLVSRSLLQRDEQGRLTLHDLQMDYVRQQVKDLPGLHQRWLAAYATQYPQGWHTAEPDGYYFEQLPYHLNAAGKSEELQALLLNFDWLQAKLATTSVNALITDYALLPLDVPLHIPLKLLRHCLQLSAHILREYPDQLTEQLWGRLMGFEYPPLQALLDQSKQSKQAPWLQPLTANLTPPGGALLRTLQGHSNSVNSVIITPDGFKAISASSDGSLKIWDIEQGVELTTLTGHAAPINSVAITPDGRKAISASNDRTLKVWDIEQRVELATLTGHSDRINSVAITPDGRKAVSASADRTLKVWDIEQRVELATLIGHTGSVWSIAITPDGRKAISTSADHTLKVWDIEQRVELATLTGHSNWVTSVLITPDGQKAISTSTDFTLKVWDIEQQVELATLTGHSDAIWSVAATPDGQKVISASDDRTLKVWDIEQQMELATLTGHSDWINSVGTTPDGRKAISASADFTLKLWNISQVVELTPLKGNSKPIKSVAITPDGKQAIFASADCTLKVWDIEQQVELATLTGHSASVWSVAITPDGQKAISVSADCTLKLWDIEQRVELATRTGHASSVWSVTITPDGSKVVSASDDCTLKLWNIEQAVEPVKLIENFDFDPVYLFDPVYSVAITPDGSKVISASRDSSLKVWDIKTGRLIANFIGDNSFLACAVTPDGKTIVAGDATGRVHFLQIQGVDDFGF